MRKFTFTFLGILLALVTFNCSNKGNNNDEDGIVAAARYFPVGDGDLWSYNNGQYIRRIDGDTVVNGVTCKRLLENGRTVEAWTNDGKRFRQHLLPLDASNLLWFKPPLEIPFSLKKDAPFNVFSYVFLQGDADSIGTITGSLTFKGYERVPVLNVYYDSSIVLKYESYTLEYSSGLIDSSTYSEIYAPGIGLISTDDWALDSAIIGGVKFPQ